MKQLSETERALAAGIDQPAMLAQTEAWTAINSGTGNLAGLGRQANALVEAFAALPGEIELREPGPVIAVDAAGREIASGHGRHLDLRVRPQAERRLLLTGHMDTVFPADHPVQAGQWLDDDVLNAPGAADMKGGIAVILHALAAFETSEAAARVGYDVMINSDEETGSLSSAPLIAELARGKFAALTYEPRAWASVPSGSGNYSLIVTGRSAHAGRNRGARRVWDRFHPPRRDARDCGVCRARPRVDTLNRTARSVSNETAFGIRARPRRGYRPAGDARADRGLDRDQLGHR